MELNEILKQVNDIFVDVLDDDNIKLTEATTAKDIEDWDSLNHVQLIVAIEKKFKIRFKTSEINAFNNVGEMCEGIKAKLG